MKIQIFGRSEIDRVEEREREREEKEENRITLQMEMEKQTGSMPKSPIERFSLGLDYHVQCFFFSASRFLFCLLMVLLSLLLPLQTFGSMIV